MPKPPQSIPLNAEVQQVSKTSKLSEYFCCFLQFGFGSPKTERMIPKTKAFVQKSNCIISIQISIPIFEGDGVFIYFFIYYLSVNTLLYMV